MKRKTLIFSFMVSLLSFTGCDYLDLTPTTSVSDKLLWSTPQYAELSINNFYHLIDAMGQFDTGQSSVGLTEGMTDILKYGCTALNTHMWYANEIAYAVNGISSSTASYFLGNWGYLYSYIKDINQGLSNLKIYRSNFEEGEAVKFEAELKYFRGWLYFELLKRYKDVILYDETMEQISKDKALNTEEEGWDFVQADLTFAAQNLAASNSQGRLTSGAANAMLSRAMMYAYRWDVVKASAEAVITTGLYSLTANYADAYSKTAAQGNTESILEYEYNKEGVTHNFDDNFTPGGDDNVTLGALGTPTQEMVESYELATGGFPDWTKWHNTSGTTDTPPYSKLEPRFKATVLYNGASWKGRTIESFEGGKDGYMAWKSKPINEGKTTTGYFLRKLVDENHNLYDYDRSLQPWISIRYAEVLLNCAEACCMIANPDETSAKKYVNEIRARVGLPGVSASGSSLLNVIRHERKVELAYEGQLYWDMRRWKLADKEYSDYRVHGLKVDKIAGEFVYTYIDCDGQDRYFPSKMYQIPLPQDELENNTLVEQFEAWK